MIQHVVKFFVNEYLQGTTGDYRERPGTVECTGEKADLYKEKENTILKDAKYHIQSRVSPPRLSLRLHARAALDGGYCKRPVLCPTIFGSFSRAQCGGEINPADRARNLARG
jgi:hypothetical protein